MSQPPDEQVPAAALPDQPTPSETDASAAQGTPAPEAAADPDGATEALRQEPMPVDAPASAPAEPSAAGTVPPPPPPYPLPPAPGYGATGPFAGAPSTAMVPVFPNGKPMLDASGNPVSDKSRLAAALLCWFVGVLGIHRFYVGKVGTGVAMLLTCGGLGVWALVDLIVILVGSFRDIQGRALQNW